MQRPKVKFFSVAILSLTGWVFPVSVIAAGEIAGRITQASSGDPISQVRIDLGYGGKFKSRVTISDSNGAFSLSLDQLFPGYTPRLPDAALFFHKDGYIPQTRTMTCKPHGDIDCSTLDIQLGALATTDMLSDEDKQRLKPVQAGSGLTLYILPYDMHGQAVSQGVDLDLLAEAIHRRVNTRLQELRRQANDAHRLPTIGLRTLTNIDVKRTDTARLDSIGKYLNALALVSGRGYAQGNGTERILLSSLYHVVPSTNDFHAGSLYVDDLVQPKTLSSPLLFEELSDEWALHTLIALSLEEFIQARANEDLNKIEEIRAYLIAQRGEYGEDETSKVTLLNDLLQLVDAERSRLGD